MTISFTVATEKFRALLSTALLHNKDALFTNVVATFEPDGVVTIKDLSINSIAVYLTTSAKFFKDYNVDKATDVVLTASLFTILDKKFKNVEVITVLVDESVKPSGKITIKSVGKGPSYDEDLLSIQKGNFTIPTSVTEYGRLPSKALDKAKVVISVGIGSFHDMPKTKEYTLICDGADPTIADIKLHSHEVGNFYQPLEVKTTKKAEPLRVLFSADYLDRLTANLTGDVWATVDEGAINLTKMTDDLSILLMLSTQEPDSA